METVNAFKCQASEAGREGQGEQRSAGLGKQSVGHCCGAYMSLVLMPAMGFRDKGVSKETCQQDRDKGSEPCV